MNKEKDLDIDSEEVETVKRTIAIDASISSYGELSSAAGGTLQRATSLIESSPITRLSKVIEQVAAMLVDADPRKVSRDPSWFSRMTGAAVESEVMYEIAKRTLEDLLAEGQLEAANTKEMLATLDTILTQLVAENRHLQIHINAGHQFLREHSDAGLASKGKGDIVFDNPRERFSRRLANLAAILASNEMAVMQINLSRAQAIDLLDRFYEVSQVLVPVWRQYTLSIVINKMNNPEIISGAVKAYDAMVQALAVQNPEGGFRGRRS